MKLRRELRLPEHEAQAVSLVRAVEEIDRTGALLSLAERQQATLTAHAAAGGDPAEGAWLGPRAVALLPALGHNLPALDQLLRATRLVSGLAPLVLVAAFLLGLATNALGPERRIQALAVPLLGLVIWNLAVLALLVLRSGLPWGKLVPPAAPRLLDLVEHHVTRLLERLPRRRRTRSDDAPAPDEELVRRTLRRFLADWFPVDAPLAAARLRRLLHAGALALTVGVVVGMYLRGLAFEYRVTWESTFLDAGAVDAFLGVVLAPAAAALGTDVPSVASIRAPAAGDAAPWIHLYAATAGLFIAVPRLALVGVEGARCAALRRRLPLAVPDAYLRRLLAATRTVAERVDVLPYSYRPAAPAVAALKTLLIDLFGPRADVRLGATLDYGGDVESLDLAAGRCCVVLLSLAQTPELEVHAELLTELREQLVDGQVLLVIVDASAYRQRLGGEGAARDAVERRLEERRRSWERVVKTAGITAVHLDLQQEPPPETLSRLAEAAWPAGVLEGAA